MTYIKIPKPRTGSRNLDCKNLTQLSWTPITDIQGRFRTCAIFIPAWGSKWGYSSFSHHQNNRDLSGVHVGKHAWNAAGCTKIMDKFARVVGKNPNSPNLSPMADDTITWALYEVWDLLCISVALMHLHVDFSSRTCRFSQTPTGRTLAHSHIVDWIWGLKWVLNLEKMGSLPPFLCIICIKDEMAEIPSIYIKFYHHHRWSWPVLINSINDWILFKTYFLFWFLLFHLQNK